MPNRRLKASLDRSTYRITTNSTKMEEILAMPKHQSLVGGAVALVCMTLTVWPAFAQSKKYDVGATDTEIKIGNFMPYSGPASIYGMIGKTEAAYFSKVNAEGGINGRKINFISYDDAYSPPKAVEQTRKLVESDEVLFLFNPMGTPSNSAIQKYLNAKKIPALFVGSGATKFGDYKSSPWTIGFYPPYQVEGRIFANYLLRNKPDAKLAIFYQNDDLGKDYLKGMRDGLGAKASSMIIIEESYELSEPTVDSHIVKLKASGADALFNVTTPKFTAQTIRKMAELGWKPLHILAGVSSSVASTIKPAGIENAQGIITAQYQIDPADPEWKDLPGMKGYFDFMDKYNPEAAKLDILNVNAYNVARLVEQVIKQCGDDLTRENVMRQAANLHDFEPGGLLPGIKVNTSPTDFYPVNEMQLMRFEGERWKPFGPIESESIAY